MKPTLIDRRMINEEELYDSEPFFTSITESVSCSSEEAAMHSKMTAARDTGKRVGLFSRRRFAKHDGRDDDDDDFHYTSADEERDNIWATDGQDQSVEVVTPFSMPTDLHKHLHKTALKQNLQQKILETNSSQTSNTWLHETVGSSSLLDGDESVSTASLGSTSSRGGETRSLLDDEDDYEEDDHTYTDVEDDGTFLEEEEEEFMPLSEPVASFLDELAENRSIRRIGLFFLSRGCLSEQVWDEEFDESLIGEDDDDDDEGTYFTNHTGTTSARGRSRSPRNKGPPGVKLWSSMASSADSILEVNSDNEPLWKRVLQCTMNEAGYEEEEEIRFY